MRGNEKRQSHVYTTVESLIFSKESVDEVATIAPLASFFPTDIFYSGPWVTVIRPLLLRPEKTRSV